MRAVASPCGPGEQQHQSPQKHQRPHRGLIPLCPHAGALLDIDSLVFQGITDNLTRLPVLDPGVLQHVRLGVKGIHPGRVMLNDLLHFPQDGQPLRPVAHGLHLLEQGVETVVLVVCRVLALRLDTALGPMEQEHEVLRVRIVGVPAQEEQLCAAFAQFVLEPVPVS